MKFNDEKDTQCKCLLVGSAWQYESKQVTLRAAEPHRPVKNFIRYCFAKILRGSLGSNRQFTKVLHHPLSPLQSQPHLCTSTADWSEQLCHFLIRADACGGWTAPALPGTMRDPCT
jgi:hypothetical protein